MKEESKRAIVDNYRRLLEEFGDSPQATQNSAEGQQFRFAKLLAVGDLRGKSVLDIGCGIGDLYGFLRARCPEATYTGIDLVPEAIQFAAGKYPGVRFLCRDILKQGLDEQFDYVLMSAIFNNNLSDSDEFIREMLAQAFQACRIGIAFNFISTWVNFRDPELAYHDPAQVLSYCVEHLSRKVELSHHYQRCDVAMFVYR